MKRLFVHTSPTINAHAIGFGRGATILFTSAILENIPATELDALVAHEVAHHINCDWVTYALYIAVVLILDMLFVPTVLGTIIAAAAVLLSGLSLSRWREHRADVFVKERTSLGPALAELLSRVALNARALGYTSTEYSPALNVFSVHYSIPERIQFLRS